ncbi:Fe2+-dependent dioxygenase [Parasphingopyxis sp.]|uniref:Fe2+-dependent dioxygenase n=1 Tax=Parasphingopyxis sp. TaxID=1920299 RepID=UPI00262ACAC7|nr:Fe2+-dependent dioxygenase [Parasphingopyxis sp.]
MILKITAIEEAETIAALQKKIAELSWRDGRETAGSVAKAVKQNMQADLRSSAGRRLHDELLTVVSQNPVVKAAARPRRLSRLLISKMADGGHYGAHVDNAMMGSGETRLRTDISFTLFLTEPADYQGGELVIDAAGATQSIKGAAGELVLYPSTSIHHVEKVTAGERIACVGWIESIVADQAQRELLFDLENLRVSLRQSQLAQSAELLTLDKTIANLMRMWGSA